MMYNRSTKLGIYPPTLNNWKLEKKYETTLFQALKNRMKGCDTQDKKDESYGWQSNILSTEFQALAQRGELSWGQSSSRDRSKFKEARKAKWCGIENFGRRIWHKTTATEGAEPCMCERKLPEARERATRKQQAYTGLVTWMVPGERPLNTSCPQKSL